MQVIKSTILVCLLTVIVVSSAQAREIDSLSVGEKEHADQLAPNDNTAVTRERYIKTVLRDTSNAEAKTYLRNASVDEKQGSPKERLMLQRFVDLVDYIDFLKNRIVFFQKSNAQFISSISQKTEKDSEVSEQLKNLQKDLEKNTSLSEDLASLQSVEVELPMDLAKVIVRLTSAREKLLAQINYLQSANTQLFNLKTNLAQRLANNSSLETKSSALTVLKDQLTQKETDLQKQNQSLGQLDTSLKSLHSEFDGLQGKLEDTNHKLADVTRKLAEITLESYEKDKHLADQTTQIKNMTNELNETTERLNLAERLLKEKDQAIAGIQENKPLAGVADPIDANTRQKVEQLEISLNDLNEKYTTLADKLEQKNQKIVDLKLLSVEKDQRLSDLRTAFMSKDQKVAEMNGILTIYRWKLGDIASQLKQREEKLEKLEKMLNDVDQRLGQRLPISKSTAPEHKSVAIENSPWPQQEILSDLRSRLNINRQR